MPDLQKLIDARRVLHGGLPAEPMHGQVPRAGIPCGGAIPSALNVDVRHSPHPVMAGLDPAICAAAVSEQMAGSSPAMTVLR
jgi:hypothetical protein